MTPGLAPEFMPSAASFTPFITRNSTPTSPSVGTASARRTTRCWNPEPSPTRTRTCSTPPLPRTPSARLSSPSMLAMTTVPTAFGCHRLQCLRRFHLYHLLRCGGPDGQRGDHLWQAHPPPGQRCQLPRPPPIG